MNGVRRFLSAATSPSQAESPPSLITANLAAKNGPSWPPQSPTTLPSALSSPKPSTPGLFLRKEKTRQTSDEDGTRSSLSSSGSPSLNRANTLPRTWNGNNPGIDVRQSSVPLNNRDELLMSLLASEAVLDSRDFEILSSEDVEDLKTDEQTLTSKLESLTKKLALETKIRDTAASLGKINASKRISGQSDDQLDSANRRVEAAQKELWRVSERLNEVQKKLLRHRAGVLSFSVRSMEKRLSTSSNGTAYDSGYDTPNGPLSPTGSSLSGSSKPRFDGAHLFAGHVDAKVPRRALSAEAAASEIYSLEEKLKAATGALSAAGKKQAEMARDLQMLQLEKQEVETTMSMDLQTAEDTIESLKKDAPRIEELDSQLKALQNEKKTWMQERSRKSAGQGNANPREVEQLKEQIQNIQNEWEADRRAWERERAELQDEKMEDLARLQEEMDSMREDDSQTIQRLNDELDESVSVVRTMVQTHGIVLFSRESSLKGLLTSISTHLQAVKLKLDDHATAENEWTSIRRKLEEDVRNGLDKREALFREVEEVRKERDELKQGRGLEIRKDSVDNLLPLSPVTPTRSFSGDSVMESARTLSILQPIWSMLPSPEARAAKFANQSKFRTGSPSPTPSSPSLRDRDNSSVKSLSELDVRSLKSLYDNRVNYPPSPNTAPFTLDSFAARVQALIQDDRALIERLIRFAQSHDLLKKNADRAQKLAQESNSALETYQKQVRTLEERNMSMVTKQATMQDEVYQLQMTLDQQTKEMRTLETKGLDQNEVLRQLEQSNSALSARVLTLAEEAASAPVIKKQLENQLAETKAALDAAQEEVDAMRTAEQSQRIALLDELNTMQTENGQLRAQIRALKR